VEFQSKNHTVFIYFAQYPCWGRWRAPWTSRWILSAHATVRQKGSPRTKILFRPFHPSPHATVRQKVSPRTKILFRPIHPSAHATVRQKGSPRSKILFRPIHVYIDSTGASRGFTTIQKITNCGDSNEKPLCDISIRAYLHTDWRQY
jgi:hypothetical protein